MVFLPVKELARSVGVSEATIVRCSRSLGYSGLRELKLALASRLAHLSLIDALYVAVATQRLDDAERVLARTDAIIAEHRLP